MTLRHQLIDILRLERRERAHSKIIDDQNIRVKIPLQLFLPRLIGPCSKEVAKHPDRFDKEYRISPSAGLMPQGLGKMGLPHAGRSVNQDMLPLLHEEAGGQIGHDASLDLRVEGEVELLQGLLFFKGCLLDPERQFLRLSSLDLVLHHEGKEGTVWELIFFRLRDPELERFCKTAELQCFQLGQKLMINHDAPPGRSMPDLARTAAPDPTRKPGGSSLHGLCRFPALP